MSQIKYIFRDFWWVVADLAIKDTYFDRVNQLYQLPKEVVKEAYLPPMQLLRRGEISIPKFWNMFSKKIWLPLHKECKNVFYRPLRVYASVYKSILAQVRKLQKLGYTCIILSDDIESQGNKIKQAGRYDTFDDVLLSYEIGLSKYDDKAHGTTKIFEYVLNRYKITPSQALFLDDMKENCEVAKKAGIKTIVATSPRQTIRDIKKILKI